MPQKYVVEVPGKGSYEVEVADPEPSIGDRVGGAIEGIGGLVSDLTAGVAGGHGGQMIKDALNPGMVGGNVARFGKRLGGNLVGAMKAATPIGGIMDLPATMRGVKEDAAAVNEKGFLEAAKAKLPGMGDVAQGVTGVDIGGGSPEIGADLATLYMGTRAGMAGVGRKKPPTGGRPGGPSGTGGLDPTGRRGATGTDPSMSLLDGPIKPAPQQFRLTGGRPITPTGTSSGTGAMRMTMPSGQRPNQFTMNVPVEGKAASGLGGAGTAEAAAAVPETSAANLAMRAAQEAEMGPRTTPPGRAPVYGGPERRSPSRVSGAAEDKAYKAVRKTIEEKAAKDRAKATLTGQKKGAEAPGKKPQEEAPAAATEPNTQPLLDETDVRRFETQASAAPKDVAPPDKSVLSGFTRTPTKSLADMVKEHGREGAAQRAGMTVDELDVRLVAGTDAAKLAKGMRDKFGSEKAARLLGMKKTDVVKESGGGASRLPEKAVQAIEAAAEKERAAGGVTPKTQSLLDRIAKEKEAGFSKVGPALALGAGGLGAATGGMVGKNSTEKLGNAVVGGLTGLSLGLGAPKLKGSLPTALALRREAFLTGGAIPKNLMTALGGAVRAGAEGTASKGRLAPMKEILRLPTNAKSFWKHFRQDPVTKTSVTEYAGKAPLGKFAKFMPSKAIGAIDDTARDAYKRAGIRNEQIDRLLLTSDNNILAGMRGLKPEGRKVADALLPFQRVPTNVLMEGLNEVGHLLSSRPDFRSAMTAAQMGSGYLLGEWAKGNKRNMWLASIALALAGPATAPSTVMAAMGAGLSGFGAGAVGGISPIPEQSFDPKQFFGIKPAGVTAYERLTGKK